MECLCVKNHYLSWMSLRFTVFWCNFVVNLLTLRQTSDVIFIYQEIYIYIFKITIFRFRKSAFFRKMSLAVLIFFSFLNHLIKFFKYFNDFTILLNYVVGWQSINYYTFFFSSEQDPGGKILDSHTWFFLVALFGTLAQINRVYFLLRSKLLLMNKQ